MVTFAVSSARRLSSDSYASRCTSTLDVAEQTWPWFQKMPNMIHSTAASISLSAKMIRGDLPPSSRLMFLMSRAAACMIRLPVGTLPVKASLSIPGCSANGAPASLPSPGTTFSTPAGSPALSAIRASSRAVNGVSSDGLSTMQQPAANAGATFQAAISIGKFHGMIAPATPIGSFLATELKRSSASATGRSIWLSRPSARSA
ncbi:hypothetical protein D3C81_1432430 [compost metagenome]